MPTINGKVCVVNGTPVDKVFSNGKQVYGRNLIVRSDLKYAYINRDNGTNNYDGSDFISDDYIATNGETVFTFSSPDYVFKGSGNHSLAMYDSDKNFLGWQSITSPTQTLSKPNAAYIRFSINFTDEGGASDHLSDWLDNHRYKLEKGSIATPYLPAPEDVLKDYIAAPRNLTATIIDLGTEKLDWE